MACCKLCDTEHQLDYGMTDECWMKVMPKSLWGDLVCLQCFDIQAVLVGVDWTKSLQYVKFTGRAGSFVYHPR